MGENRKSGSENPVERRAANCLRKSLATNFFGSFPQEIARQKLFRPISSGNRPPQNFFSQLPEEIARHKLFRLISSGNRAKKVYAETGEVCRVRDVSET